MGCAHLISMWWNFKKSVVMTPNELKNLIQVKTDLAAKYRRKALNSGSQAKRVQSNQRALSYERQVMTLEALAK